MEKSLRIRVLLTMQVALLGRINENINSVLILWNKKLLLIKVSFENKSTSEDMEILSEIESEVISHLPDHEVHCINEADMPCKKYEFISNVACVFKRASREEN